MSNFGFDNLRLVTPYELAFREARSAVGATHVLTSARQYASLQDAVADCDLVVGTSAMRDREIQHPVRDLPAGAALMRRKIPSRRIALLFGSEKRGLSNEDLSYCDWLMHIPTGEETPSMNLGQAVAVCLYEISRTKAPHSSSATEKAARSEDIERIQQLLHNLLVASGYVKPNSQAASQEKLRRMLRRFGVRESDAMTLQGMLRQIEWKLRAPEKK